MLGIRLLLPLLCCIFQLDAFKILVYSPAVSKSHLISNARIANTLAKAGHNVTLLETEYRVLSSSLKYEVLARRMILTNFTQSRFDAVDRGMADMFFEPDLGIVKSLFREEFEFLKMMAESCDEMFQNYRETLLSLRDDEFDIFVSEQMDHCGPALKHLIGAKSLIWISSTPLMEFMGNILGVPTPSSFVPSVTGNYPEASDNMTFYQRLRNIMEHQYHHYVFDVYLDRTEAVVQKHFGPNFPLIKNIIQDVAVTFVLADEFLAFPRPILHNIVYVGGGGMEEATKHALAEPYRSEMQKGARGVVFFSMGSMVKTSLLPFAFKKHITEIFASLPDYYFIVKIDEHDTEFADLVTSDNVRLVHWVPQPAILAHDRLKLFITHGGYNSLLETVHAGKPAILLPFFADQWTNGRLAERNQFGRVFDKRLLLESAKEFRELLAGALDNPSLQEHVLRIRKLIRTKPMSATERLLAYTNFVGENREFPELHVSGRKFSTVVYYNLDIFAVVGIVFLASIAAVAVVSILIIRWLLRYAPAIFSHWKTIKCD